MLAKNTLITSILLLFSVLLFLSCDESTDNTVEEILNCSLNNPSATINTTEINLLKHMREEEKLARDVYIKMYELHGLNVFNNISQSEQRHMNDVLCLLEFYEIDDPASDELGVFENSTLQDLYDALIIQGNTSLIEALKVAATIEDVDIYDLMEFTEDTSNPAIISIFDGLTCGSRNHMRSFISQLTNNGATYTPQFINETLFDEIINSNRELCGNN